MSLSRRRRNVLQRLLQAAFLLICVISYVAASKSSFSYPDDHICWKILTGQFDSIKAFTWYFKLKPKPAHFLVLLEGVKPDEGGGSSRNFAVYNQDTTTLLPFFVPIGYTNYTKAHDDANYKLCIDMATAHTETIRSLYWFRNGYNKINENNNQITEDLISCHLLTDKLAYSVINFNEERTALILTADHAILGQEYSLVYGHGTASKPIPLIYAFSREIINNRYITVIHMVKPKSQLKFHEEEDEQSVPIGKLLGLHYADNSTSGSSKFYSFQKTSSPSEVLLVHRDQLFVKTEAHLKAQLFQRLPSGFAYQKKLYLFDGALGCVYIITEWDEVDLDKKFEETRKDLKFTRTNRPYELFFNCTDNVHFDTKPPSLNASRCDTVLEDSSSSVEPQVTNHIHRSPETSLGSISSSGILYLSIGLIIAVTFVLLFFYAIYGLISKSNKKAKNKNSSRRNNKKRRWFSRRPRGHSHRSVDQSRPPSFITGVSSKGTPRNSGGGPKNSKWFSCLADGSGKKNKNQKMTTGTSKKIGFAASYSSISGNSAWRGKQPVSFSLKRKFSGTSFGTVKQSKSILSPLSGSK